MKKRLNFLSTLNTKGFTLIELLVVIGILGILSSALVATIDPFEQLKKGNDANTKNVAVEFLNANMRYYMTHSAMPWTDASNTVYYSSCTGAFGTAGAPSAVAISSANALACVGALINDGELKTGFTSATGVLKNILVSGSSNTVTVCFQPESKAERNNTNTKWDNAGLTAVSGCPNATSTLCHWCTQ